MSYYQIPLLSQTYIFIKYAMKLLFYEYLEVFFGI